MDGAASPSGNAVWTLGERHCAATEVYSPQTLTQHATTTTGVPTTQYEMKVTELTITGTGIENQNEIVFHLGRDGQNASDTSSDTLYVSDIEILYLSDRLGE